MFADLAQSSRFVIGQDPEDADERLLAVLQLMVDSVHRFGGTVNQILGDGIMALFGVPRAEEDYALRACLAARSIHAMVAQLTGEVGAGGEGSGSLVRVGIASGEVVVHRPVGNVGIKYRATGEAVYKAQRLEAAAPPGATLIDQATLAQTVGAQASVEPFGAISVMPDAEPVEALRLTAVDPAGGASDRLLRGGSGHFVGRSGELKTLQGALDQSAKGTGCAVVVCGEAGIGKSRLLSEFVERSSGRQQQIVNCHLLPAALAQSGQPAVQVMRRLLQIGGFSVDQAPSDVVDGLLGSLGVEGQHARAAVLEVLGDALSEPAWLGLDPADRLRWIAETVSRIACAVSRAQPLIIVFEDYHWADSETQLLADCLAEQIRSARVLLLVTCRSHYERTWSAWPGTIEQVLQPLSRSHCSVLLDELMGMDDELGDLKSLLILKTQGNPFFIEECVRSLQESGDLVGSRGACRLAVPVSELQIPTTVHDVLATRIDTLPAAERATLLCASVIGLRADVGLLKEIEGLPREELLARLDRLQEADFLERTRIMPNLEYSFRHHLIHAVAYGTLLKRNRRRLHGKVLGAIERRRSSRMTGRVELLAHHAYAANNWPKAVAYCRRAGLRTQARSANREAKEFFAKALQAICQVPRTGRAVAREIDIRLEFVDSLLPLGNHDEGNRQLEEARRLATELGDERRFANITSSQVPYYWMRGDLEQALQIGKETLAMARRLGHWRCEIRLSTRLGSMLLDRGEYLAARKLLEEAVQRIPANAIHSRFGLLVMASVSSRTTLARALGELGFFAEAIKIGDEGIRIAEENGHVFSQIYANLFVGNALLRKGDFERSLPPLSRSFELCSAIHAKLLYPLSAASLGYAHVRVGEHARGLELLESAACTAEQHTLRFQLSLELTWLAEAHLLAGDSERALAHARQALNHARSHGEQGGEAWALWLLGWICAGREGTEGGEAEERLMEARQIAESRQMRPLIAHIDSALGQLYARRKNRPQAQARTAAAVSSYRRLGMTYWLRGVDGKLRTEVPDEAETLTLS
ncbi:MAG: AAA family ATPase [Rhodospirillales bacterium]|nr:AAA family ATPase [Rhodospirillales bacterium]